VFVGTAEDAFQGQNSWLLQNFENYGQKSFITLGPGWKGLPETNAVAYLAFLSVTKKKVLKQ
jgi:hypothetical protein